LVTRSRSGLVCRTGTIEQHAFQGAAASCAAGTPGAVEQLGLQLGLNGYPTSVTVNGDTLPKTGIQYIETHDHQRFICNFGTIGVDNDPDDVLLQQGDRDDNWPKIQPYLIALMTAKGTPLLSEGQEFCENYWIPGSGYGRVMLYRPVRWNYFYDNDGQPITRLLRKLTKIRRSGAQYPKLLIATPPPTFLRCGSARWFGQSFWGCVGFRSLHITEVASGSHRTSTLSPSRRAQSSITTGSNRGCCDITPESSATLTLSD
jgi:hypothetical protein